MRINYILLIYTFLICNISCELNNNLRKSNFYYSVDKLDEGYKDGYNQLLYFPNDSLFFYKYYEGTAVDGTCGKYKVWNNSISLYPFSEYKQNPSIMFYKDSMNCKFIKNNIVFNNDTLTLRRRKKLGVYKNYPPKDIVSIFIKTDQ